MYFKSVFELKGGANLLKFKNFTMRDKVASSYSKF